MTAAEKNETERRARGERRERDERRDRTVDGTCSFVFYTLTLNDLATRFRARSFSRERVSHRARHGVDDGFLSRARVPPPRRGCNAAAAAAAVAVFVAALATRLNPSRSISPRASDGLSRDLTIAKTTDARGAPAAAAAASSVAAPRIALCGRPRTAVVDCAGGHERRRARIARTPTVA